MNLPLSVCLIVRNEEANIRSCLESVRSIARQVIVVDTGSTDQTREIAEAAGAEVHDFAWCDDFSRARNYSLEQANQPHILVLDADERLDAESLPALRDYLEQSQEAAGRVRLHNLDEADDVQTVGEITRLFPNSVDWRYSGRIHEQLTAGGLPPRTVSTEVVIRHHGYTEAAVRANRKAERNLRLLLLELEQQPDNPYLHYQIGKTCYVDKRYRQAAEHFQAAVDVISSSGDLPPYTPSLLNQYAYSLLHLREFPALFDVLGVGTDLYPDYTDLYFVYGTALIERKDPQTWHEIREVFEHCLSLGEPDPSRYESVRGVGSYRAEYNLGVYYEVSGGLGQAVACYTKAAAAGFKDAQERLQMIQK